jgi:hypothetical protein
MAGLVLSLLVGSIGLPDPNPPSSLSPPDGVILGFDDSASAAQRAQPHLSLKSKVLNGPLAPGISRPLVVTVRNPFGFTVKVTSIKAVTRTTSIAGCSRGWFKVKPFKSSKKRPPLAVRAHKRASLKMTIRMVNLLTVNQDACKSATFRLALTAKARRA